MDRRAGFLVYLEFFICRRLSIYMHHVTKVSGLELSSSTTIDGE